MPTKDDGGQQRSSRRSTRAEETEESTQAVSDASTRERQEKLASDTEALLDEIDEVLEENAEEFVKGYVQKGGQ